MSRLKPGQLEYYYDFTDRVELPVREFVGNTLAAYPNDAQFRVKVIELLAMLAHNQAVNGQVSAIGLVKWAGLSDFTEITGAGIGRGDQA